MSPMPRNVPPYQPPPEPPAPRYRVRWSVLIGVPLALGAVLFVLHGIEPSFRFEDLMRQLGVANQNRYVRLACLCVVGIVVILIAKSFRNKPQ